MSRDLFSEYPELYEEFKQFCDFSDIESLPDINIIIQQNKKENQHLSHQDSNHHHHHHHQVNLQHGLEEEYLSPISPPPTNTKYEINFMNCKRHGPSYRSLPDEYHQPKCSGRTELCNEVLNDQLISVPTGSEDGFKTSIKNQFEENLFACEDERYELDMVIEINTSTIQALLPIIKELKEIKNLKNYKIEDGLNILHLRSIERIYGHKGHLMIQALSENPVVTIPILLSRLQQKDKEWRTVRSNWNFIWQEIYEKNYYRSLDHQSVQFKQKEKKLLNPRELLAEIKNHFHNNNEKSFSSSSTLQHLSIPSILPNSPSSSSSSSSLSILQFEMKEKNIFPIIEDLIEFQGSRMYSTTGDNPEKLKTFINFIRKFFLLSNTKTTTTENETQQQQQQQGVFFGNNSFYVFFRFFQMLYDRLLDALQMTKKSFENRENNDHSNLQTKNIMSRKFLLKSKKSFQSIDEKFSFYLNKMLKPLIDGDLDFNKYEDLCRELFGISSFVLFTMDRLLQVLVKQVR